MLRVHLTPSPRPVNSITTTQWYLQQHCDKTAALFQSMFRCTLLRRFRCILSPPHPTTSTHEISRVRESEREWRARTSMRVREAIVSKTTTAFCACSVCPSRSRQPDGSAWHAAVPHLQQQACLRDNKLQYFSGVSWEGVCLPCRIPVPPALQVVVHHLR